MTDTIEVPICPKCGKPMLYSCCIMSNEYVCIPCGYKVPYFNGCEKVDITKRLAVALRNNFASDIHTLSYLYGGATCSKCLKTGGNNCDNCKIDKLEDLLFWGKGWDNYKKIVTMHDKDKSELI